MTRFRLARVPAMLTLAGLGVALLLVSLLPWLSGTQTTPTGVLPVRPNGLAALPAVPSVAVVIALAGIALGLAGRVLRVLAALGAALVGALGGVAVLGLLREPDAALLTAAGEITGVAAIDGDAALTPWPVLALILCLATVLVGLALPFVIGDWSRVGRRYERGPQAAASRAPRTTARGRAMDDWDALSRGEDPTEGQDR